MAGPSPQDDRLTVTAAARPQAGSRSSLGGELRRGRQRKRAPDLRPGRGGPGGDAGHGQGAHRPSHPWDRVVPTYLCSKGSGVLCKFTSWSSGIHKGNPRQFGG